VHGDARLVPFGASFPLADEIADLLHYSGYVASDAGIEAPPGVGAEEIVVSAGGGAVGRHLIETARAAHRLIGAPGRRHRWRVLAGGAFTPAELARLAAETGDGLVIEPTRADFPSLLRRAALSVSQAGYNTVTDILSAGVRSILVPFAAGQETEQTLRARALQAHGRALVLDENALTPEQLAGAIARALELPPPGPSPFALDGAAATVRLIRGLLAP
jgi:predicted glycosyltransferase